MAWVNGVMLAAGTVGLAVLFHPWSSVGVDTFDTTFGRIVETIVIVAQVAALGPVASLFVRHRRGDARTRLQLRWVGTWTLR